MDLLTDSQTVFVGNVLVRFKCWVVKVLLLYALINQFNLFINLLFLCFHLLHFLLHLYDLAIDLRIIAASYPPNSVLVYFLYIVNALQYVCYVINTPFLHSKHLHCLVQIHSTILAGS